MFAEGKFVKGSLTPEMSSLLVSLKGDEWARFCGAVTDWERDMYLTVGQ